MVKAKPADSAKVEEKEKKQLTSNSRNYTAAPKRTLNLAPISAVAQPLKKSWVAKAEEALVKEKREEKKKETKRERKRRLWNEKKENDGKTKKQVRFYGNWEYLPDLCLELVFQYLPHEVIF